jgi:putative transposase
MLDVAGGGPAQERSSGRAGVRTRKTLVAILGGAAQQGARGAVLREAFDAIFARGDYAGSVEELTPVAGDPVAAVPVLAAFVASPIHPLVWVMGWPSGLSSATPEAIGELLVAPGEGAFMEWTRVLAYITGSVDQELLLRNEYLATENRILRAKPNRRLPFSDAERATLGEIGFRLGRRALSEVAAAAQPETILARYRRLVARKFDGSHARRGPGRPRIDQHVDGLIVRMARENRSWGYDRIVRELANLRYHVSDQTVGNVLRRHDIPPAPERKRTTTWAEFIRTHLALLAATDFFTVEVLTLRGLVTYYVLFFIHLESRRVDIAGITADPNEPWTQQIARNVTMDGCGILCTRRYLLHDRDTKYSAAFRTIIQSAHIETLPLPARSPNLNAHAERWVRQSRTGACQRSFPLVNARCGGR